jgi:lipopolysaccharide/colanic/teichoic acid biosynthesis glycosyltransferase
MSREHGTSPIVGRGGVQLVAADLIIGIAALPLAALVRELLQPTGIAIAAPEGGFREIERPALWFVAALSALIWPAALRAFDPGYPSAQLPLRRVLLAALIWLLAASGAIYLLDKALASRALVLLAALLVALASGAVRLRWMRDTGSNPVPHAALPELSRDAEQALARGEPISISLERLQRALPRPTIILEGGRIWIYPSVLSPTERLVKRILDVVLASLLILVLSPVIVVTAAAVLIRDGRPIFYSDERAGLFGRPFRLRKFRTMFRGAEEERAALWSQSETAGPAFKVVGDPRITPLGRVLRRFSLDELPQLFDVIAGRMSLVGPRPAGLDELAQYEDRHRLRLTVRPGVTGLWQVRRRLDNSFEQRMDDDLEYIQRWSILLDLWIVLRTVRVVLAGRGV